MSSKSVHSLILLLYLDEYVEYLIYIYKRNPYTLSMNTQSTPELKVRFYWLKEARRFVFQKLVRIKGWF